MNLNPPYQTMNTLRKNRTSNVLGYTIVWLCIIITSLYWGYLFYCVDMLSSIHRIVGVGL